MSDQDWKKVLTPDQFYVCRQKGTERPFTGKYWDTKDDGIYHCVCCKSPLFTSDTKYDSGSGWPSFFQPVSDSALKLEEDDSHSMRRTEVLCKKCGSHLGHVFDDGPKPTGLRYCMNSAALELVKKDKG